MSCSTSATHRVAWLALVCHVLVASGLPLPVGMPSPARRASMHEHASGAGRADKDRSRPFPCMNKPCGCATAEQCFANCCCHTPAERLAWAEAHRVEPAVLAALERRVTAGSSVDLDGPDVCSEYQSLAAAPPAAPADEVPADMPEEPGPHVVILRDMLSCGGVVTAWLACAAAVPPPRVEPPTHDACAGFIAVVDALAASALVDLSAPPPRVA